MGYPIINTMNLAATQGGTVFFNTGLYSGDWWSLKSINNTTLNSLNATNITGFTGRAFVLPANTSIEGRFNQMVISGGGPILAYNYY